MTPGDLGGVRVIVAGAGLAGLAAARDLMIAGATVSVLDSRDRTGGRVWTIRDFAAGQHAEAGGDMIDEAQLEIRQLVHEVGLRLTPILRGGWGYVEADRSGRARLARLPGSWERIGAALAPDIRAYKLAEQRWDSPISTELARQSVASWLDRIDADQKLRAVTIGLRGFFLADPDELSMLAYVDQFATEEGLWRQYRVQGGNGRLATALATLLGERLRLTTQVVAASQHRDGVRVSVKNGGARSQISGDYLLFALPATLLDEITISPPLPAPQHDAIARLKYGRATRTLLQFSRPFWRGRGRPSAFGSSLPFGAVWDANEEQRGGPGILTLLAGGSASDSTQAIVADGGAPALVKSLSWLGTDRQKLLKIHQTVWEADPWARGGYAFFDPSYDPTLRAWLPRSSGRLFFAGEHTSARWQGYMNGAVESGRRAAAEIAAVHRLNRSAFGVRRSGRS